MPTPVSSMTCFLFAAFLGALGQLLYKSGADRATGPAMSYIANPRLIGGVACYISVMVLFVAAFKRGGSLTVLYPLYATTFVWAMILSWWVYNTPIRPVHAGGFLCLVAGMYLMGK